MSVVLNTRLRVLFCRTVSSPAKSPRYPECSAAADRKRSSDKLGVGCEQLRPVNDLRLAVNGPLSPPSSHILLNISICPHAKDEPQPGASWETSCSLTSSRSLRSRVTATVVSLSTCFLTVKDASGTHSTTRSRKPIVHVLVQSDEQKEPVMVSVCVLEHSSRCSPLSVCPFVCL